MFGLGLRRGVLTPLFLNMAMSIQDYINRMRAASIVAGEAILTSLRGRDYYGLEAMMGGDCLLNDRYHLLDSVAMLHQLAGWLQSFDGFACSMQVEDYDAAYCSFKMCLSASHAKMRDRPVRFTLVMMLKVDEQGVPCEVSFYYGLLSLYRWLLACGHVPKRRIWYVGLRRHMHRHLTAVMASHSRASAPEHLL